MAELTRRQKRVFVIFMSFCAFYTAYVMTVTLHFQVFQIKRDDWNGTLLDGTNRVNESCLPEECDGENPLLFKGLLEDGKVLGNASRRAHYHRRLAELGRALLAADDDAVLVYAVFEESPGALITPGNCTRGETKHPNKIKRRREAGISPDSLSFAYIGNAAGAWNLALQGGKPYMSLGLMQAKITSFSGHPLVFKVNASHERCWRESHETQKLLMLHRRLEQALQLAVSVYSHATRGAQLPGKLAVRTLTKPNPGTEIFSLWRRETFTFLFCNGVTKNITSDDSQFVPKVSCDNGSQSDQMTLCREWRAATPKWFNMFLLDYVPPLVWQFFFMLYVVPLFMGWLLDRLVWFLQVQFNLPAGATTEVGRSAPTFMTGLSGMDKRGHIAAMPIQLRPEIFLFGGPKRGMHHYATTIGTFTFACGISSIVLLIPTQLQQPGFFGTANPDFDTSPGDCNESVDHGNYQSILFVVSLLLTMVAFMLVVVRAGVLHDCRQANHVFSQIGRIDDGAEELNTPLIPSLPLSLVYQMCEKLLVIYLLRFGLFLIQITIFPKPWDGISKALPAAGLCAGLYTFAILYIFPQYMAILQGTLTALFWLHAEKTLFAAFLVRWLLWEELFAPAWHQRVFPVVARCLEACAWANDDLKSVKPSQGTPCCEELGSSPAGRQPRPLLPGPPTYDTHSRVFLRLFQQAKGLNASGATGIDYPAALIRLREHVGNRLLHWTRGVVLRLLLVIVIFILADKPLSLASSLAPLSPHETILVAILMFIAFRLQSSSPVQGPGLYGTQGQGVGESEVTTDSSVNRRQLNLTARQILLEELKVL